MAQVTLCEHCLGIEVGLLSTLVGNLSLPNGSFLILILNLVVLTRVLLLRSAWIQDLCIEQHLSCLGARGIASALRNLSLQSFSLGSTVSMACVDVLRGELSRHCVNLETLSLSLTTERAESGAPGERAALFPLRSSGVSEGPVGCAKLRSIRLQRCSEAIIPQLSQVVEFCRARSGLRSIAIIRLRAGEEQWSLPRADSRGHDAVAAVDPLSDDPFERMLTSCTALERLELSAADAWPVDGLVRLMKTGGRGIVGPKRGARIRRLTIHDTDALAHKPTHEDTATERSDRRSDGRASATRSPTVHYEATLAKVNASTTRGATQELFFAPD